MAKSVNDVLNENLASIDATTNAPLKREIKTYTVKAFLNMYKAGKIRLPDCQRLFVWSRAQQEKLLISLRNNNSISVLELAQKPDDNDVLYLLDGQQRITSITNLLADPKVSADDKKIIGDYPLWCSITYGMNDEQIQNMFSLHNSGVDVASVVKQRTKLTPELRSLVIDLSSNDFFKNAGFNVTASKGHHHELIAENALLAAANLPVDSIKAADVRNRLNNNSENVIKFAGSANRLLDALISIFKSDVITDYSYKKALNNNFMSILLYVLRDSPKVELSEYPLLINYVFAKRKAVNEYAATTRGGSGSSENCKLRYNVIIRLLKERPYIVVDTNTMAYEDFLSNEGTDIATSDGTVKVPFDSFTSEEKKDLYEFMIKDFKIDWDDAIRNKFNAQK